jgi:hypothetical protein
MNHKQLPDCSRAFSTLTDLTYTTVPAGPETSTGSVSILTCAHLQDLSPAMHGKPADIRRYKKMLRTRRGNEYLIHERLS